MKLNSETTLDLDAEDLAALLTEEFCGTYSKFENLRVEYVSAEDNGRTFKLVMTLKPKADGDTA